MEVLFLIGRILLGVYFVYNGVNHLLRLKEMAGYTASMGVPFPTAAVAVTGLMLLFGGITVALGAWAQWGALVLILFLVPVALVMHRFWGVKDPMMAANQQAHFLKNIALAAACLALIYLYTRPGFEPAFSLLP